MAPPPTDVQTDWTDGSADWSTPGDWSEGVPIGAGTSALLGGSGTYTVTIASGESFAPDSVTLDDFNAVLALNGSLATIGGTTIEGGTLQDAGNLSGPEVVSGGVLLEIGTSPFTLDNTITLAGGTLSWVDTQSHTADVTVPDGTVFIGAGEIEDATYLQPGYQPGTVAPTPYPVVLTNLGTIETAPSVTGNYASDELFLFNSSLTNDGLIESNGGLLEISGSTFDNASNATLEGLDSAYIDIFSPFSNAGLITATGGTLSLGSEGTWVNTGSIVADNASVVLGGDDTEADYGALTLLGTSALDLDGTLENAGNSLNASSTLLHGLTLDDGSIIGGTLDTAALGLNLAPYTSNTLDGVTVINGLTVTGGGITLSNGSAVFSDAAAQTLATIEVGTGGTLGFTGIDDYAIGQDVSMAGGEVNLSGPFTLDSTIAGSGGTIELGGQIGTIGTTWVNDGVVQLNGGTLDLDGDETAAQIGSLALSNTTLVYVGGTLENAGETLNGSDTSLLGLTLDGATIAGGTLDAGALSLAFSAYTPNVLDDVTLINGLTVSSGNVTLADGSAVYSDAAAQTLATVDVAAGATLGFFGTADYTIDQDVAGTGANIVLDGPFTLDSTISDSGQGVIELSGSIGTITTSWVNDGVVQADGANITLEGDETVAQIGSIADTGGTLFYDAGTLDNTGGTLNASDTSLLGMVLDGGTIEGGTLDPAALDLQFQSAFSEVYYLAGHLDNVSIINNFTVGGAVVLSGSTAIYADASATTPGTITVTSSGEVVFAGAGPLTLDNPVTLEGGALTWAATPTIASTLTTVDATIAAADIVSGSGELGGEFNDSEVSLTNLGTIDANASFETLAIDTASLTNDGLLEASDSAALQLGTLTSVYDPTTGTYDEVASSLLNSGTISLDDATLDLDADATVAQLGSITNSGGTIVYTGGTLDNTGGTLNASNTSLLGLQLDGGTIEGGTLDVAGLDFGVSEVGYSYEQSDLDNVAVLGNLSVAAPLALSGSTAVFSDTTASAPGTLTVQDGGAAVFIGSAQSTLTNAISLVGGDLSWAAQTGYGQTTPTVAATIAADDTVSGYGFITGNPGFETSSIDLTNLGTIDADTSFDTLAVDVATLTNDGLIEASNSAVVQLGSVSNVYDPASGSYDLVATSLVNAGSISLTDANLVLEVDATPAQLGAISNSGGTIYYAGGTLDNTGGTLNASDTSLLGLQLDGGTIEGGTLDTTGLGFGVSGQEFGYYDQSDLDNVTIINNLTVDASLKLTGTTAVYSDATATTPGTITVQSYGNLGLGGSAQYTLGNPIVLEGGTLNWIGSGNSPTVAATIAGSELVSGIGYIEDRSDTFNDSTDDVTNLGTIEATGSNFSGLWIDVSTLDNQGLIEALPSAALSIDAGATDDLSNSGTISGGTLSTLDLGGSFDNTGLVTIDGGELTLGTGYDTYVPSLGSYEFVHTTFVNTGTISATDGTVVLDGDENVGDFGSLTLNDSTLLFSGVLENAGLRLDSTTPVLQDMTLAGGTIEGGALDAGASGLAFASGVVSTLDNVAIVNDFTLNDGTAELSGSSAVYADNSETTPGNIRVVNGLLAFSGAGPFTLDNPIILQDGAVGWIGASGSSADVTIAAGEAVQGWGGIYDDLFNQTAPDNLTNAGTIDADIAGETLAVDPTGLTNQGLMEATDAGTLAVNQGFDRNWVNAAGATISGTANSDIELGGSFSNAGLISSQAGTLTLGGTFINTLDVPTVTTWTNAGTVSAFDAVVNLAGDETAADIGTLNLTQSALYYTAGTLDNTGGTLDGSSTSLLGLQLQGATILGGTIDAAALGLTFNNNTLNTLANVTLINDFTVLGGAVVLDGSTAVYADGAATQTGLITVSSGTVAFEGAGPFTLVNPVILSNGVLGWIGTSGTADVTIAQSAAVVGSGGIYSNPFIANEPGLVTNAGIIAADVSGQTLAIAPTEFANSGLIEATSGGTLAVQPGIFTNLANGTLSGGNYDVDANSTILLPNLVTTDAATLTMSGTASTLLAGGSDIEATLGSIAADGTLALGAGRDFVSTNGIADAGLLALAGGGFSGSLDVLGGGEVSGFGSIASGTITDAGSIVATGGALTIDGALAGSGIADIASEATLVLDGADSTSVNFTGGNGTLALSSGGSLYGGTISGFTAGDSIVLQGFAGSSANFANGTLTISGTAGTVALDLAGGYAANAFQASTDSDGNTVIGLTAAQPLAVTAPATISVGTGSSFLLTGLSVADSAGGTLTVQISDQSGLLAATSIAGATVSGGGPTPLVISGDASAVNTVLGSVDLFEATAAPSDQITVSASDDSGNSGAASILANLVVPPQVLTPNLYEAAIGQPGAVPNVSVSDTTPGVLNVVVSDQSGALSATSVTGGTVSGAGGQTLTLSGNITAVNAELATLTYTGQPGTASDTITVNATDAAGAQGSSSFSVQPVPAPELFLPTNAAASAGAVTPIDDIYVLQGGDLSDLTPITLTLSDSTGILNAFASMGTITGSGSNSITITGDASDINTDLGGLTFSAGTPGSTAATLDTLQITASEYGVSSSGTLAITNPVSSSSGSPVDVAPSVILDNSVTGTLASNVGASYISGDGSTVETANDLVGTLEMPQPGSGVTSPEQIALEVYNPNSTPILVSVEVPYQTQGADFLSSAPVEVAAGGTAYIGTAIANTGTDDENLVIKSYTESGIALPDRLIIVDPEGGEGCGPPKKPNPFRQPPPKTKTPLEQEIEKATQKALEEIQKALTPKPNQAPLTDDEIEQIINDALKSVAVALGVTVVALGITAAAVAFIASLPADAVAGATAVLIAGALAALSANQPANANPSPQPNPNNPPPICMPPPPPPPNPNQNNPGTAWGDVHLTTFDGVYYNFQAAGEFVLAKSTTPGDSFQVQIRLQPWFNGASVTVITAAAVAVGADRITFAAGTGQVRVDNQVVSLTPGGAPLVLSAGTIQALTANTWEIRYVTGETVTVTDTGAYLNVDPALPLTAAPGSVEGLLGTDSGNQANEFTLSDGTVLPQPLSYTDLYTTWANAWRITDATSLFYYANGQSTETFTDPNFPSDAVSLADIPASVLANAESLVAEAGITDPGKAQAAIEDYVLTGDPSFITSAAQQQAVSGTNAVAADPTNPNSSSGVGVAAVTPTIVQSADGTTAVEFTFYVTGNSTLDQTVSYQVAAPDATYVGASEFAGGTLPSGEVTIPAGQTATTLTLDVLGSLGTIPDQTLDLQINTGTNGLPVLAPTANAIIENNTPVAGNPALPAFVSIGNPGSFTQDGTAYTLDLGAVYVGESIGPLAFDLANEAVSPGDDLSGSFASGGSSNVSVGGLVSVQDLTAGGVTPLAVAVDTSATGTISETITFAGSESNSSGYQGTLGDITLTVTGDVVPCFAAGTRVATPGGEIKVEKLQAGDRVLTADGAARDIVWVGHRLVDCRRHPRPELVWPVRIRAGAFAEGTPCRDLLLSPDHAVFADGVLIPVKHLLNGATIVQERVDTVHYFHVELDRHDILLAEGLPAESYLDTGNREQFANGGTHIALHPDFSPLSWDNACAPLCTEGAVLAAVRQRLLNRMLDATGLQVLVGGRTLRPAMIKGGLHRFLLPAGAQEIEIVSPTSSVTFMGRSRHIGICVGGIIADGKLVPLESAALAQGFYPVERDKGGPCRWTDGAALLHLPAPLSRPAPLELLVRDAEEYSLTPAEIAPGLVA